MWIRENEKLSHTERNWRQDVAIMKMFFFPYRVLTLTLATQFDSDVDKTGNILSVITTMKIKSEFSFDFLHFSWPRRRHLLWSCRRVTNIRTSNFQQFGADFRSSTSICFSALKRKLISQFCTKINQQTIQLTIINWRRLQLARTTNFQTMSNFEENWIDLLFFEQPECERKEKSRKRKFNRQKEESENATRED